MTDDPDTRRPSPVRRPSLLTVTIVAAAALAAGVLAAFTDGADGAKPRPARVVAVPAPAAILAPAPPFAVACARPTSTTKAPAAAPVPQDLLDAFGVLRRERTDADALPDEALRALRARGLEPFDPAAARLLRTTADGGRAWVVPVRDATVRPALLCPVVVSPKFVRPARPGALRVPRAPRVPGPVPATPAPAAPREPAPGAPPASAPAPAAPPASAPAPAAPPASAPAAPRVPAPAPAPAPAPRKAKPRPGLAVVALGGAPAGGGGVAADLVRGRAPVGTDLCGGPAHDMWTVSGIVPDGVSAAFLTSPDGTAVRADVKDNAYAFVVPRPKTPEQRYVVWTGGDGTPHVGPVPGGFVPPRVRCAKRAVDAPRVTPTAPQDLAPFVTVPARPLPVPPRRHR
jgi:hypothetical protein